MTQSHMTEDRRLAVRRYLFLAAAALQVGCGLVFVSDIISEMNRFDRHTWAEFLGVVALIIGASVTFAQYRDLLRRNTKIERELGAASGAFEEVI